MADYPAATQNPDGPPVSVNDRHRILDIVWAARHRHADPSPALDEVTAMLRKELRRGCGQGPGGGGGCLVHAVNNLGVWKEQGVPAGQCLLWLVHLLVALIPDGDFPVRENAVAAPVSLRSSCRAARLRANTSGVHRCGRFSPGRC